MSTASARLDSPVPARAAVESLLRARKLDRTLTSSRPEIAPDPGVPFDVQPLDAYLHGGLPAGQLSEVVGPPSSGRTTVVWRWMAAATRRGETVALIDTFDRFDPESACGVRPRSRSPAVGARPGHLEDGRSGGPGVAARRAHGRRSRHDGGAHRRSRAEGAQPGAAVGRVPGGGDRHGRRAADRPAPHPLHHVAAPAAGHRRQRHHLRADGARAAGPQRRRRHAHDARARRRHAGGRPPVRRAGRWATARSPRTWPGGARGRGPGASTGCASTSGCRRRGARRRGGSRCRPRRSPIGAGPSGNASCSPRSIPCRRR